MSLWLCLRFDQLPLQCLNRSEERPVAVLASQRVLRANDNACALGIKQGMGSATLRALVGDQQILLLQRKPEEERRCLQQLCCWAYGISPSLHIWREDCLQMEIGSCLALFGDLSTLLNRVESGLAQRGYHAQCGLAATIEAAWLLSFTAAESALAIQRPIEQRLAPLPLSLLTDFVPATRSLQRAGLNSMGDILSLPASSLARRCGSKFSDFLKRLLGQQVQPQANYSPPATFSDEYWFGYEVKTSDELLPAVRLLLTALCRFLRNTQLQTAQITWQLAGIDHQLRTIQVRSTTADSDYHHWYSLTEISFEQLQLTTSAEGVTLLCRQLSPAQQDSVDLFGPRHQPLSVLPDRLRSRLGLQAVSAIGCRDEHLPEQAFFVSCGDRGTAAEKTHRGPHPAQRPFWLLPQPQTLRRYGGQLYWHGRMHLLYGPERIEDNWWRQPACRDYYVAIDENNLRYWVFYDRIAQHWYLHGIFS